MATKLYVEFAAATSDIALKRTATDFVDELAPCVANQASQANVAAAETDANVAAREHARAKTMAALAGAVTQQPSGRAPAKLQKTHAATTSGQAVRSPRFGIATLGMAGVGVAAVGVGAFFSARAQSASDTIHAACTKSGVPCLWTAERQATEDRGQQAAEAQWVFYGVGGVALVTAGTLYYLGHRKAAQRVAIVPTSGTAGILSWSGAW